MPQSNVAVTLHQLVHELDRAADALLRREFGMTHSQFQFLATLLDAEQLSVTGLARALGVSKAAVSKRAPWFVHRGYVGVSHDLVGARTLVLSATPKGAKFVTKAEALLQSEFESLSGFMPKPEMTQLGQSLEALLTLARAFAVSER